LRTSERSSIIKRGIHGIRTNGAPFPPRCGEPPPWPRAIRLPMSCLLRPAFRHPQRCRRKRPRTNGPHTVKLAKQTACLRDPLASCENSDPSAIETTSLVDGTGANQHGRIVSFFSDDEPGVRGTPALPPPEANGGQSPSDVSISQRENAAILSTCLSGSPETPPPRFLP